MELSPHAEIEQAMSRARTDFEARQFQVMREETRRRAYSMALQLTRNPSDAEDLVQETYLKAWRGFDSYLPGKPFLNWLLRIMQRAYLDSRRRQNPIRKAESLNSMVSPGNGEVQEVQIADPSAPVDENLLIEEFRRELHLAMDELPSIYREAMELCDLEEMSYAEIADYQGTTVGTVRSRIHRGRRLLREIVQQKGISLPSRAHR